MNYETFQPAPAGYLEGIAALCRQHGALLIIDETRRRCACCGKRFNIKDWKLRRVHCHTPRASGTEAKHLHDPRCFPIRHSCTQLREQMADLRSRPPRNNVSEREERRHAAAVELALTQPDPTPPKAIGSEDGQNALRAHVLERLPLTAMGASAKAEGIDMYLVANHPALDIAYQFVPLGQRQPDLLRSQIGDRSGDRANLMSYSFPTSMTIEKSIDQVQIARSAVPCRTGLQRSAIL
jgi:hypothetical protein